LPDPYQAAGRPTPGPETHRLGGSISCTWDISDKDLGAYSTTWFAHQPIEIGDVGHQDPVSFFFDFGDLAYFGSPVGGSYYVIVPTGLCDAGLGAGEEGTYVITPIKGLPTPGHHGLMLLVALMGIAGIRKLRA